MYFKVRSTSEYIYIYIYCFFLCAYVCVNVCECLFLKNHHHPWGCRADRRRDGRVSCGNISTDPNPKPHFTLRRAWPLTFSRQRGRDARFCLFSQTYFGIYFDYGLVPVWNLTRYINIYGEFIYTGMFVLVGVFLLFFTVVVKRHAM